MPRKKSMSKIESGFFEEQLFDAQRSLFFARSVKEAKFLTNRINFLREQIKQSNGRGV
jgi:hypothetical protein